MRPQDLHFQDSLRILLFLVVLTTPVFSAGYAARKPEKYELVFSGARMDRTNPLFVGPGSYFRVSRKTPNKVPAMSAYIPLIKDLPADTNSSWRTFMKIGERWQETLVRGHMNFCALLESKVPAYKAIYSTSNLPPSCPVPEGNYSIEEYTFGFDSKDLPAVVVGSEWRIRNWWTTGESLILCFTLEVKVDRNAHH